MNSITGVPMFNSSDILPSFNPTLVIIIVVVILLYLVLFGYLGGQNLDQDYDYDDSGSGSGGMRLLGIIAGSIFLVLIVINGFNHLFNINIITSIRNFFSRTPEIDIHVNEDNLGSDIVPEIESMNQVYHIPGNKYTYDNARAVCKAFGNRLATYKEIEHAYNNGADWCSYGWSENQLALFPTQYDTWNRLQSVKGHENDCGRPGINGGFIDNQNVRFGVNCYGHKPKITSFEAELMENTQDYPVTQNELNFQRKVDYWKTRINDILISPFNSTNWSKV